MLDDGKCSIYSVRPQTCLDYDCRIFAAAGIDAGEGKVVINKRVHEWRFSYPERTDELEHAAVRAAAAFIRDKRDSFTVRVPAGPMGIAVFAIKGYEVFLDREIGAKTMSTWRAPSSMPFALSTPFLQHHQRIAGIDRLHQLRNVCLSRVRRSARRR